MIRDNALRDDHRSKLDSLCPDLRRLVETQLLPEQMQTHDILSYLEHPQV